MSKINCQMSNVKCCQKGYSLIELVVVLAIFIIIVGATVNIFISVVRHQKRILQEQELLNQVNYTLGYVSTSLRTAVKDIDGNCLGAPGYIYLLTHCSNGILQACNGVKFINRLDNYACQEFFLDDSVSILNPPLREIKNNSPAQNLLSDKFKLKYGRFIVNGDKPLHVTSDTDLVRPRITILLDIQTESFGNQQEKLFQTTISQRN